MTPQTILNGEVEHFIHRRLAIYIQIDMILLECVVFFFIRAWVAKA